MKQDLEKIHKAIKQIKHQAEELRGMVPDFPAVDRNLTRILASIRMLELNICDIWELTQDGKSS